MCSGNILLYFSYIDERLKQLVILVKEWCRQRGIKNTSRGFPGSHCYTLWVINFFQSLNLLPILSKQQLELIAKTKWRKGDNCKSNYQSCNNLKQIDINNLKTSWIPDEHLEMANDLVRTILNILENYNE